MFSILVTEDDKNTRKLLATILAREGYAVHTAEHGAAALDILESTHIDAMLVDVMMPVMDGYTLTKRLRDAGYTIPILMVTVKHELQDKRAGFVSGVDDYITKPFDEEELLLRLRAILRRSQISAERKLAVGDVELNYDALSVTKKGEPPVTLPKKEFYLIFKLLSCPDKIFTRYQLMDEIWGMDSDTDERTVNVHINRLRERFRDYPEFEIVTIRGLGYKAVRRV